MIYAIEVNSWTIDLIEKLNEGVRPSDETLKTPTIFLWSPDPDVPNDLLEASLFDNNFMYRHLADVIVVEER